MQSPADGKVRIREIKSEVNPALKAIAIEPMRAADWTKVREIFLEGVATGKSTFETAAPEWPVWDAKHHEHSRLVARAGGDVVGWVALSPVSSRAAYAGVAELSIYVAAAQRGKGIGRLLLDALIEESERHGIWTLQTGTFPENVASVRLQQHCGFRIVGRRERVAKLSGEWRDILMMERRSAVAGIS